MTNQNGKAILVTGATGGIGRRLVELLAEAGEPVRALCRRPEQVADFRGRGVDAVLGDLGDPASLEAAMRGADRLFLLTAPTRAQREHGRNGVEAARRAGLARVVYLSTADLNPDSAIPWVSAHADTGRRLQASGTPWTLLKPSAFMQNFLESAPAIKRGLLPQTSGRGAVGWIDSADIAEVAAQVVVEDGHEGREHVLTGPELLSVPEVAARLSTVLGHRVRYLHLPSRVYSALLRLSGLDAWMAEGLRHQYVDVVRHGQDDARVMTDTVQAITGREPVSIAQFAEANRAVMARSGHRSRDQQ